MAGPGVRCPLCNMRPASRRLDITDSDVDSRDAGEYEVRAVLRGLLLCSECINGRSAGQLLAIHNGVEIVRGCLVQCADEPPWWLRRALPGGARVWRKTVCPCCGGRATIQIIADVV